MSWPVRIVLPCEKIRRINWKGWFYSLLAVSSLIIFIGWLLHSVRSTESENSWGLFYPCLITGFVVYSFFLALRVYYYGMCLAANEAYLLESTTLRKEWSEWANQEVVIAASHLFLPADIHLEDLAAGSSCAIYNGQTMTLHKVGDVAYTEEQLFYELLSSIRATLQKLSLTCVFDVVFAYDDNYSSFPTFMECWISIGLPSNCIENHFFIRNSYESVFEKVINAKKIN
ncbi:hypothetical protein MUU49_11395 [Scandinavium goeteborgense]|uniref:hypothetical protein n=1 Tax=Scandinavium goeteborgense TaxID=1851514 RepID=UPI002166B53C|nr:hypothetical protein [Scandinavium goeteborgense]MCS2153170.1 hypothetical protein [Scandinavium goeteborgense]